MSHLPGGYGIWFYCNCVPPTVLLWLFLFLWTWSIFFFFLRGGRFQCPPVDDCLTTSWNFGALALLQEGDEHMSLYSAILNWKPRNHSFLEKKWVYNRLCIKTLVNFPWISLVLNALICEFLDKQWLPPSHPPCSYRNSYIFPWEGMDSKNLRTDNYSVLLSMVN